ncbi:unnamed protein product, partial [Staurois parvus]
SSKIPWCCWLLLFCHTCRLDPKPCSVCPLTHTQCSLALPTQVSPSRGGLTIWKLGHFPRAGFSRGPHEMPLVPFS